MGSSQTGLKPYGRNCTTVVRQYVEKKCILCPKVFPVSDDGINLSTDRGRQTERRKQSKAK